MQWIRDEFMLSDEPEKQQPERIYAYLTHSYWAEGISLALVKKSLRASLCLGLFHQGLQIGLARVVTDRATFAYLCDVYVLEEFRGHQLGVWLMETVMGHPELQGLRRLMLATRDAHELYRRFGFAASAKPETLMEICRPGMYLSPKSEPGGK